MASLLACCYNLTNPRQITRDSYRVKLSRTSNSNRVRCCTSEKTNVLIRKSGNFAPTLCGSHFIQSLTSEFVGEKYSGKLMNLKEEVKTMIEESMNPLEMIDIVQRLGIANHFESEIETVLKCIFNDKYNISGNHTFMKQLNDNPDLDLYTTALEFRLLRQQGYNAPQEIFNSFKDEDGNFKANLCDDLKGLINLYEASYLLIPGETILEEAQDFACKNILLHLKNGQQQQYEGDQHTMTMMMMMAERTIKVPLRWRIQRVEAKWFIDVYENSPFMNPTLLHFAKLDFNMCQAIFQDELKDACSWWKETKMGEKLDYVKSWPAEEYVWTIEVAHEPKYTYLRKVLSRLCMLVTVLDDTYDVHGTYDELELFTNFVERWDINAIHQLPEYMQILFLALHNTINEIAREVGPHILPRLCKEWTSLCKAYLLEVKWCNDGYTPTLEEYLENAVSSIAIPLILVHGFLTIPHQIPEEPFESPEKCSNLITYSSMIARLVDDLGTSKQEMGDNPKAIECYMHETGKSEEEAREHIHYLIGETWKKLNEEQIQNSLSSKIMFKIGINTARICQYTYTYVNLDGYDQDFVEFYKNLISSLIAEPICLN